MKGIVFFIYVLLSLQTVSAQHTIRGKVTDQKGLPLPGANIFLPELNRGTISDTSGSFHFQFLPAGKILLQVSFIGYSTEVLPIVSGSGSDSLIIQLHQVPIATEDVVITGAFNTAQHQNIVKIDILKPDPFKLSSSPNFMEAIAKIPGVDMISKGSGVSKPVIRGLSMNDILVLDNGVRFENYQYSDHHPLGIDEFGIGDVEVIKGPASLLYGSDAIGGVLNFVRENPAPVGMIMGDYSLQLFSNTLGITNNFGIKGSAKNFFGGIRVGYKNNADFLQGGGAFAPNSRFNEYSVKADGGITGEAGTCKLFYESSEANLGMAEAEAINEIGKRGRVPSIFFQQLTTHLLSSQNKIYLGNMKLDINPAIQSTQLVHIGELNQYEIQMRLTTLTYETKLNIPGGENSQYILGFQGMNQINENKANRPTILLPDASTNNYSFFGLAQYSFQKKFKIETGLRFDKRGISTTTTGYPDSSSFRPSIRKSYNSVSGSVGASYSVNDQFFFRANLATAYRTPNLAELTSNGVHETRYETGNPGLIPENSYEGDLSMHYHRDNLTMDLAGYYNRVDHYIFIRPTGTSTISGIPVYVYAQSNSVLYGGEAGLHFHPAGLEWLHLLTTGSMVVGKQVDGTRLPFIPAHKIHFESRVERDQLGFMHTLFASFGLTGVAPQSHPAPEESSTAGYMLIDLMTGATIHFQNQDLMIGIGASNLLDKKYTDHLSTLREVGLYNPGRNITFTLRVPFSFQTKQNI